MAYKYFTEKLLGSGLDLTQVFPEKQEEARIANNVTYSLLDIVVFLKDRTNDFRNDDKDYIDLDNAISEIISRYYKSKNEKNPFVETIDLTVDDKFAAGEVPQPITLDTSSGGVKSKGKFKPAKSGAADTDTVDTDTADTIIVPSIVRTKEDQDLMNDLYDAIKSLLIFEDSLDAKGKEALSDMMNPETTGITKEELEMVKKQAAIEKEKFKKQGII